MDELSPVQNKWLRKYTKPSLTVVLKEWAKNKPSSFTLEYLLSHALESHWDLTEEGWNNSEELGLLANVEKSTASDESDDGRLWLTHKQAVAQLQKETASKYSETNVKKRITTMANKGRLKTNGKKHRERRYLKSDIDLLELKLRNECLKSSQDDDMYDADYNQRILHLGNVPMKYGPIATIRWAVWFSGIPAVILNCDMVYFAIYFPISSEAR